jgi:hypothetical protein
MNAVEIEQAISDLALAPFDAAEFPFAFLTAFGNKDTTLKRLRAGNNNTSDVPGGVLLRNHIHIAVCAAGDGDSVGDTLSALRASPATAKAKAKFILATDGQTLQAQELVSSGLAGGETIACDYADLPNHFGFLLPLAGISTIQEIKDNPIDVRATGRLNKLYVELLTENPAWALPERRADMNHFMARLIFCFFAEDTDIFNGEGLFTQTVIRFSEPSGSNTHEVLSEIFRAMNTKAAERAALEPRLPNWANGFPYVNGGLFSGSTEVPRFTRMARTYLQHAGGLNWQKINSDIFGSMIQAVADDEERGALGMHYTSVPNILKVLNPLFLDELRAALEDAGSNERKLLNLRKRMARIRVFDPACGSGNFLVIAYKQMREIEAEINRRRSESSLGSEIPLTNFRGIELRDFPAEIARLALIIAEFQCDVLYRGQKDALAEFLPLNTQNWIVCGNALRLDWLSVCPPTGTGVKLMADDFFGTPLDQAEIEFENEGGETYICGNPPYLGSVSQSEDQKSDLKAVLDKYTKDWKSLDYVAGWFMKAAEYGKQAKADAAFVSTNSICQGEQTPIIWPLIFSSGHQISFAYRSFKWSNLASHKAGVTVVIVAISEKPPVKRKLFDTDEAGGEHVLLTDNIGPYLVPSPNITVQAVSAALDDRGKMFRGNMPNDGGHLVLTTSEAQLIVDSHPDASIFIKSFVGSKDFIRGLPRYCIWIEDHQLESALQIPLISERIEKVRSVRLKGGQQAKANSDSPHRFVFAPHKNVTSILVPRHFSEHRKYITAGLFDGCHQIVADSASVIYGGTLVDLSVISSRLHLVWMDAVAGRIKTDYRYSGTLVWNTFPVPLLTEQNKVDLTRSAEAILLAREAHFPATIADLYDPATMPANLRAAHEHNDEVLERIYIGRRFKNDTERLEKLFELYTKMTAAAPKAPPAKKAARRIKA